VKLDVWVEQILLFWKGLCGTDKSGVAGSGLALLSRDEPLVSELLSCCFHSASSWFLQKVKLIQHVVGLSC
jgi:hypothetical protein